MPQTNHREEHRAAPRQALSKTLRPFGTSIFTEMTTLSNKHGAVNLSQGFPDFDGPDAIKAKAAEALIRGPNQYAPSFGIPALRQAIARKMQRFYGLEVNPDEEITVTTGATGGIAATLLGILEPGDEVVLLEPFYDSYAPISLMAGAEVRTVPLAPPDFSLPREALSRAFSDKTKAVIVNTPQNPCGKVYSAEELSFIGSLCVQHDCFLIADEVYEHLVYDGRRHVTALSLPELRDRAFVVSSTAKTFSMTGWKVGYVIAAPELTRAVRMSHQFLVFCGQSALQEAMAFGIDFPDDYYHGLLNDYTQRRDRLCGALVDMGFSIIPPEGTYYVNIDINPLGYDDDLEFCRMLIREAGVGAIPSSFFWKDRGGGRNLARFCFCKKDETLDEAVRRLRRWRK